MMNAGSVLFLFPLEVHVKNVLKSAVNLYVLVLHVAMESGAGL